MFAAFTLQNICSIYFATKNAPLILLQHPPCKMYAACHRRKCTLFNIVAASNLQNVCSIYPAKCLKHPPCRMFEAPTLKNVCSINPESILLLHTSNIFLAFNPCNILVPMIGQKYFAHPVQAAAQNEGCKGAVKRLQQRPKASHISSQILISFALRLN